jgi:hypothetical protein
MSLVRAENCCYIVLEGVGAQVAQQDCQPTRQIPLLSGWGSGEWFQSLVGYFHAYSWRFSKRVQPSGTVTLIPWSRAN